MYVSHLENSCHQKVSEQGMVHTQTCMTEQKQSSKKDANITVKTEKERLYLERDASGVSLRASLLVARDRMQ